MLAAQTPVIRVAAAVYLCSDQPMRGEAALQELRRLPGEAGERAAVALARRGDMAAASRLVQMLDGKPKSRVLWSYLHFLLRDEARVLLSNSARASQVPAPHPPYQSWWEKHTQRMVLADPWLPQLERQRIE